MVNLRVPPLRERREDVPLLARAFISRFNRELNRDPPVAGLSAEAESLLLAYAWPGNVRELENAMERAVLLADEPLILPANLPERLWAASPPGPTGAAAAEGQLLQAGGDLSLKRAIRELEESYIRAALRKTKETARGRRSYWTSVTGHSSTKSRSTESIRTQRRSGVESKTPSGNWTHRRAFDGTRLRPENRASATVLRGPALLMVWGSRPSGGQAGSRHFLGGVDGQCYAGCLSTESRMAKGKLVLGLDIGSTSIKMILLKEQRKRGEVIYALQSFGMKPLPPEAIVDGALMNSTAIVQAVQDLMSELKVKGKDVAIGVSGHSVIIKKIQMPRMSQDELEESIQWEAEQYIPFDVKDVNIDTQILDGGGNDATGQMDVLLVAAKKDMINDYTTVVSEAGLAPVVVDVDAFAVQNMFSVNYDVPDRETVVLINAGASVVNINIISNGATVFTRDVTIGGNQFTEEIQKQLNVSYEEAEALKIGGNGADADAVVPQDVERVLSSVAEQVAGEIQRSLDFYAGTAADSNFSKVYLSGGTAKIPALFKTIEARTGVPVEILNPFRKIEVDNRKFDPAFIMDVAPMAAVAVGLALRRPGDKLA